VFASAAGLLSAAVRHRHAALRRCAALLLQGMRHLLLALLRWDVESQAAAAAGSDTDGGRGAAAAAAAALGRCAGELARLQEAVAERGEGLGRFAAAALAEYVAHAAAALQPGAASLVLAALADEGGAADAAVTSCSAATAGALRRGAYALLGAAPPAALQHVHVALGRGAAGGLRRGALAELRRDYERHHKYAGKV
jgi:hypothetical protein